MNQQRAIKIHSPSPYESLDDKTAEWLRNLRIVWPLWKNSSAFSDMLFDFFSRSENPHKSVLSIMVSCGDFYKGKQDSLSFVIMQNFSNWVQTQNITEIPKSVKVDAINLVNKQRNSDLLNLVIETFKAREDKELFIQPVKEFVRKKKYKEACQLASFLGLHEYFGIEEFLVPLVFQEKYHVAEMFINDSKNHQVKLAVFLDEIIGKPNVTSECVSIARSLEIFDATFTIMRYKALSKLLTKLVRKYNLSPQICPNMNRKRGKGILHFLLNKRYVEKSISGDSWTEMMLEAVGDDKSLQEGLVKNLTFYKDLKEALVWAEKFGVPKEVWPRKLLQYSERDSDQSSSPVEDNLKEDEGSRTEPAPSMKVHKFPLEESQIKLIDTAAGFHDFLVDMTKGVTTVGIDAEWKPSFGVKQADLALIQVAAFHSVYILDVMALASAAPQSLWERFSNFLFDNQEVLKIGFDTRADLQMVKETFRKFHCLKKGTEFGFLDLAALWQTLVYNYKFVFPFPSTSNKSANLSRLIQMCLGETLDKSDQFSNWENRPLRKSQIIYAAIDAYCLLEAYDVMVKESKSQNIPISEVIEEIVYGIPGKKTVKKGGKHQKKGTPKK